MENRYKYKPGTYFLLAYAVTLGLGFAAAYCSYSGPMVRYTYPLLYIGAFGPAISTVTLIYTSGSHALRADFLDRLINLKRFNLPYLPLIAFLVPAAFLLSVRISMHFGGSPDQLNISADVLPQIPLIILAPIFEEVGWRGYGIDALRSRLNVVNTTLVFACLWIFWHAPLFFINHFYQHDLLQNNPLGAANWAISVVVIAFIANWFYYRNGRLILAVILLHFATDLTAITLNIGQLAKYLVTAMLLVVAVAAVTFDRKTFGQDARNFLPEDT